MKIIVAEHYGMCFGVRDAIAQAKALAQKAPLTILGELVHNPLVRDQLRAHGAEERPRDATDLSGRVMITAHGTSDARRRALRERHLDVSDATCPLVKHAHTQLARLVRAGYFPIVIGLAGHVEVRGLTEDFPEAVVVSGSADIPNLPHRDRYGVISQTTQPIDRVRALIAEMARVRPDSEIRFVDTVCKPTKDRQHALKQLVALADAIVVIGGRHSNNTRQLVETCREAGRHAIHVERPEELNPADFVDVETVGVTAGTSTLPETVAAVVERLQEISRCAHNPEIT
ncbi:MAG: 4-hydroxy-3-methylbut-2-enyl diphosphate reductase [Chthoniobacterales bacterium]